jgi:hypothetical protein
VLPFALPPMDTDVTLRAALEQGVQASLTQPGTGAVMPGGEMWLDARAESPRALYTAELYGMYARVFNFALGGTPDPPEHDVEADATLSAMWIPSPATTLSLEAHGDLATSWGVRADTALLDLDPFLFGRRLEYDVGPDFSYSLAAWPRGTLNLDAGYEQAGALAADTPAAVGVDTHDLHGGVSFSRDLGPGDTLTPELRYEYTHYEHALLGSAAPGPMSLAPALAPTDGEPAMDAYARGPADVHAVSLTTAWSHEAGRAWRTTASGGVTLGSPMPGLGSSHVVVAPKVGASLRWTGRRTFVTARYAYAYASLGPRIGYGQEHTATIHVTTQPADGARLRDLVVTGIGRFSHGGAPLAADPESLLPGEPPLPPNAKLTTTTAAGALLIEYPIRRGLAFTSRFDLVFVDGVVDPPSPAWAGGAELTATLTLGIAFTVSTDKRRTVRRDAQDEADQALRRELRPYERDTPAPLHDERDAPVPVDPRVDSDFQQ